MDYARRYMLMKLSESLTDEERRILAGQDREVMSLLEEIKKRQSFGLDVGANVVGNFATDGLIWIVKRLLKR